jgi:archaellin
MGLLQQQTLKTSSETIKDVSTGLKITHVTGYYEGSKIHQLSILITTIAASDDIDLSRATLAISDSSKKAFLSYNSSCFNDSITGDIFNSINPSYLKEDEFGILVIRDNDNSCSSINPIINEMDLIAILINATVCFSGLEANTGISGRIYPEYGIPGSFSFTIPSALIDTIIDLYP